MRGDLKHDRPLFSISRVCESKEIDESFAAGEKTASSGIG
jgi:hypothetical protein